jgi:hypothetical protein
MFRPPLSARGAFRPAAVDGQVRQPASDLRIEVGSKIVTRIFPGTRLMPSNVLTDAEDGLLMLTLASHSGPYPTCPSTFA